MDRSQRETLLALRPEVVLEQWLREAANTDNSYQSLHRDLSQFFAWAEERDIPPLTAEHSDINRYVDYLDAKDWEPASKRRPYSSMRSFFAFVAKRWRVASPMEHPDIHPPPGSYGSREDPVDIVPFSDFPALMGHALAHRNPSVALALVLLGINGLKLAEVRAADVSHIDRQGETLWLRLPSRNPEGKTPIVAELNDLVDKVVDGRTHGPLLRNAEDRPMSAGNVRKALATVCSRAGVDHVGPQRLRNTAGAIAATERSSSAALMDMLGLSSRAVVPYMAHAENLKEEHPAFRVWRRVQPGHSRHELLDQADRFLAEGSVPVAAIVLAGAALEEYLRTLCRTHGIQVPLPGSIDKFKGRLIGAGHLAPEDGRRIDRWKDLRNAAAHAKRTPGHQEAVSMVQEVRSFVESGVGL